ncbi:MAG: RDD family protein [Chitinophagaceae bacterium]
MDQTTPNVLQDFEHEINLEPVSTGSRFVNYLIDVIVFYAIAFGVGLVIGAVMYSSDTDFDPDTMTSSMGLQYLISFVLFLAYYTFFETVTKGRTVGKMVTGSVAVKEDGSQLTAKDAFLRSLCRLIPFEPFSALFGRPWHDSITKTMVVKKQK